ncbi:MULTISPECIES: PP2C family protein-serine/threonine phosphatase [Streptomyces]|uniref:PP2C family protein-serine/threonine phosphatase n=1 Tax=Streptomyces TaxID=1883 RepID=UPI00048AE0C2|nr:MULTISPECIES: SpoIIE family protein phosphatase [unclassified Streptomyces]MYY18750.1 SpoIIE family protein phosphatase [Streptomyces sp. SID4912]SCE19269.1 Serine phosphatase RsbU, regulator of sigma subunit [Streptomyces sp. DpondAA-D4]SCE37677.1 Serine phosphatase RsbU, regulator of sigma subunit [Streptomyces sp. PpalLS-921]
MPSHLFADRPAPGPPERTTVDALISRTRRLRGDVAAVRRDTSVPDADDPQLRWRHALCELAVNQLDDLGTQLGQLRDGVPEQPAGCPADGTVRPADAGPERGSLLSRVGSAEWNLLTDEVSWSDELYAIFGREPGAGALSLDELPSVLLAEDQPVLTAMVTDCLVDGSRIDGEIRILLPDGRMRTLHMMGEPVLDADGCTASMWAVLRDVSRLRRSRHQVDQTRSALRSQEHRARTERRMAVELHEAVLPPWRGTRPPSAQGPDGLDVAAHHLPADSADRIGGDWYDALRLPDGGTLLTVGDLTGHGVLATSGMATLLGALRAMAVAGIEPGPVLGHLNELIQCSARPALASALCCRFDPATGGLVWAQAGHPAPLLFRDGVGRPLPAPDGVLLGAASGVAYEQDQVALLPGDVLMLHTEGLTRRSDEGAGPEALLDLAPRFARAGTAQDCLRTVVAEFGGTGRLDDACVLVARVEA